MHYTNDTPLALLFTSSSLSTCTLLLHETCYPIDLWFRWENEVVVILVQNLQVLLLLHCLLLGTPISKQTIKASNKQDILSLCVLTDVTMMNTDFWDVMQYSLVDIY